ncbi:ClpP/crotonase-like domain-containing protein [Lineolata rhizophorae]|uniref:3-hydroxyisobutyryl-CoA hydrolase n=1 Tax=Lineolata rhizophorae TaxID=578093 RepID=A0A6A6NLI8_9PEZI|nr:ClpP/crotonase-like domain-containing protein [Lineolata rhizophorae]
MSQYSSEVYDELIKEQPGDDPDDVVFGATYGVRTVELNRPKKLNSLNGSMARKIIPRLQEWSKSQMANIVVMKGAGRAFCAGGDVAALAQWNKEGVDGQAQSAAYFGLEYSLDHFIATYSKPYVAYMDGITMGGGVGLSIHAPFRIATENTVFAMPETTIGFFPDVGASFFLPRMDGGLGMYLALTSEQLRGVDAFYHGIATHYVHSSTLPTLESRLAELTFADTLSLGHRQRLVANTIEEFVAPLPSPRPTISGPLRAVIDACFGPSQPDVQSVLNMVQKTQERHSDEVIRKWAEKTLATLRERSPTSVAVTFATLRRSAPGAEAWDISETFIREHGLAKAFMAHPDFVEGVSARLIEKRKGRPNWQPNTIEEVTEEDVQTFFMEADKASLQLLNTNAELRYRTYPHGWIGLPAESEIEKVWMEMEDKGAASPEEVIKHFVGRSDGKVGVAEKVKEYGERRQAAAEAAAKIRAI